MIKKACAIGMLFFLTGCGSAATVNNVSITTKQIDSIMTAQEKLSGKITEDAQKARRLNEVNNLVEQNLLVQEAKKTGIKIDNATIQTKYNELLVLWKSGAEVQKSLESQGYTEKNLKDMAEKQLMIEALTSSGFSLSDEQVMNYYKSHSYDYATYTLQKVEAPTEQEANKLFGDPKNIKEITLSFMQLPYETGKSIRSGVDLINKPQTVKNNDAVFWVVKIIGVKTQPFEEVKEQVRKTMQTQLEAVNTQELLLKLRKEAKIEIN